MLRFLGRRLGLNSAGITENLVRKIFRTRIATPGFGPVIIDIGANRGDFTKLLASMYSDARIIAIEPQPELVLEIEKLGLASVITICAAVTVEGGQDNGILRRRHIGDQRAHIIETDQPELDDIRVRLISLDQIIRENLSDIDHIDLLKIDAEGWDFDIIKGCRALLKTNRVRTLLFEIDFRTLLRGNSFYDVEIFLRDVGFEFLYRTSYRWGLIPLSTPIRSDLSMTQNLVASRTQLQLGDLSSTAPRGTHKRRVQL